jgi:hypothetical protein
MPKSLTIGRWAACRGSIPGLLLCRETAGADFSSASSNFKALGAFFPFSATLQLCHSWIVSRSRAGSARAPVYHILWVRVFRTHTISGPGFNLFKPLWRHFAAASFCRHALARDPSDRNASAQKVDRLGGLRRDGGARPKSMWKFQIVFHDTLRPNDNDWLKLLIFQNFNIPQTTLFGKTKVHKSGPQGLRP